MLTRRNVLRRDGHRCQYCGSRDRLTLDHVLPKSRGGPDSWDNLVAACVPCNNKKGNHLRDFLGTLDDAWKPYLYAA
jgi:5-methylcytosine-specific restriction endonuclease McrA